jgi:dTDP-glucose 4,6-dehydratase
MSRVKRILVTGGAGFIGSALVRHLIANTPHEVLVYDKLTYAGTLTSLELVSSDPRFYFLQADICDADAVAKAFAEFDPDVIAHLAAESHVRSMGLERLSKPISLGLMCYSRRRVRIMNV